MKSPALDWLHPVLTGLLLLGAPTAGHAQLIGADVEVGNLPLDELLDPSLAVASLHEERSSSAPAAVFVLTGEDLRAGGFRTLSEALRAVPGLFTYSDGFYQYTGVRGTGVLVDYTTRLLVQIDGHSVNNTLGIAENSLGPDLPVPFGLIERIEVVKGPAGGVYGPTAFLGVVNVVTRSPTETGWRLGADGEAAQSRLLGGRVSLVGAGQLGGWRFDAGVETGGSRGYTWTYPELAGASNRPAPPGGRVAGVDGSDAGQGYLRATWRDLSLQAGCAHSWRRLPSAPYSSIILDSRNHEETTTCFARFGLERPIGRKASLTLQLGYDRFSFKDLYGYEPPLAGGGGDVGPFRDRGDDGWFSAEARLHWAPAPSLRLTAGAAGERHETHQFAQADLIPPLAVDPVNGMGVGVIHKDYSTLNTYLVSQWEVVSGATLHASLSFFHHQIFGQRLSPRVALVWRATERDVVKVIYSEGFRTPTAAEAFFNDVAYFIPAPDLRPEVSRSAELRYERRLGTGLSLSTSLFHTRYSDLIVTGTVPAPGVTSPDPANPADWRQQATNSGSFEVLGGELGGVARLHDSLTAYGGISLQRPSSPRPNFPGVTANLALSTRALWRPLTLSLLTVFTGRRDKDLVAPSPGQATSVGPVVRLDTFAVIEVPGVAGLSVQAGVANLLDAVVLHPVPADFTPLTEMPEPPRTFRLGVRYRH